jgi:polar amino acid transport system permease protein
MIRELGMVDVLHMAYAMRWTLLLTLLALTGGGALGLLLAAAGASSRRPLRVLARLYVGLVQGIPLLDWLFVFFFGVSILGFKVAPLAAATLAYSVYAAAFLGEIWRGALVAVPRTQWEAGASIGLSYGEQLRHVIIPQAVRLATPATVGFLVQLIKNTSLAAVIGFVELTREGQLTTAATFQPFWVYSIVAALYFSLCFPLTRLSRSLEGRLRVAR